MESETLATPEHTQDLQVADIKRKMTFTGTVVKTTLAGAVVDIGLDFPGVVHISQLQKDPVNRVEDVVQVGQQVAVWVRRVDPTKHRIELTMIEPLALEWREIDKDMVLKGKVVRLEKFGAFVDIGAERPGLVHISEMTHGYIRNPGEVVKEGDEVEVKVLGVNRRKKQIKLSMKALEAEPEKPARSERPARSGGRGKEGREQPAQAAAAEAPKEEAVPTAMEMALRDAMERAKTKEEEEGPKSKGKRKVSNTQEMEDILSRTLQNKVKTASK